MHFSYPALAQMMDEADVLVFDLNGLIVDDEPVQWAASNAMLRKAGYTHSISERNWIDLCVGRKAAEWIPAILQDAEIPPEKLATMIAQRNDFYAELMGRDARALVREGFFEILAFAKQQPEKRLAIATSTSRDGVEVILGNRNLDILSAFDFVVCGDQIKKAKPHPDIYLAVKAHFGEELRYLVFEDAAPGVLSAVAAGMSCLAVPNAFTAQQDFSKATAIIDNLSSQARILAPKNAVCTGVGLCL